MYIPKEGENCRVEPVSQVELRMELLCAVPWTQLFLDS